MKFEQLRKNFLDMEFEERMSVFSAYVQQRTDDLRRVVVTVEPVKKTAKKDKQLKLNSAQLDLLKKLGLI